MKKSLAFAAGLMVIGFVVAAHADTPRQGSSHPLIPAPAPAPQEPAPVDRVCAQLAHAGGQSAAWSFSPHDDIKSVLSRWARKAGWRVVWNGPMDWTTGQAATYQGSFAKASCDLINDVEASEDSRWSFNPQWFLPNKTLVISVQQNLAN
jgi:hypothetical protein